MTSYRMSYLSYGFCEAIHRSKIWCNLLHGHDGKHWAPRLGKNGTSHDFFWDDKNTLDLSNEGEPE